MIQRIARWKIGLRAAALLIVTAAVAAGVGQLTVAHAGSAATTIPDDGQVNGQFTTAGTVRGFRTTNTIPCSE